MHPRPTRTNNRAARPDRGSAAGDALRFAGRTGLLVAGVVAGLLAAAAVHAAPAAGRYEGLFCVATRTDPPDCGPARVDLRRAGEALVHISDLLYALTLNGGKVDVVLKHGAMQIDGFSAAYEWQGNALRFVDADKGVRYEVQLGERRP